MKAYRIGIDVGGTKIAGGVVVYENPRTAPVVPLANLCPNPCIVAPRLPNAANESLSTFGIKNIGIIPASSAVNAVKNPFCPAIVKINFDT